MKAISLIVFTAGCLLLSGCVTATVSEQCAVRAAAAGVVISGEPPQTGYVMDAGAELAIWPAADGRPEVECTHWRGFVREIRVDGQRVPAD